MSSSSNQRNVAQLKDWVDFAIITIREAEFRAALQRVSTEDIIDGQKRHSLSSVMTKSGNMRTVAVVRTSGQGGDEAENTARHVIEDLDPDWQVLVGIAGGLPRANSHFGDVVLAPGLHDFATEPRIEDEPPESGIASSPMDKTAREFLSMLPAHDLRGDFGAWNSDNQIGMTRPGVSLNEENFYRGDKWIPKVKESLLLHFPDGRPTRRSLLITGPTTSSDSRIKVSKTMLAWQRAAVTSQMSK